MSNPFENFGIRHLSASSVNLWRSQPGLWAVKYLLKPGFNGNAATWRGNAVEKGLEAYLRGKTVEEAVLHGQADFEANAQGDLADEVEKERGNIPNFIRQACSDMGTPTLIATQLKCELWIDDVSVPFVGYMDFIFEHGGEDLKTTYACPSAPRPDHQRQVALYSKARNQPFALRYVTPKKSAVYPIENVDEHIAELRKGAMALERYLARFRTINAAVECLPMDTDHFMWDDAAKLKLNETLVLA